MDERGTDTRSEMDESGGLSLSAAEDDKGQSSRHRDTMESTITCSEHTAVTGQVIGERSPQNGDTLNLPGALCLQLWRVRQPVSPVSALRARPRRGREPAHRGTGTT